MSQSTQSTTAAPTQQTKRSAADVVRLFKPFDDDKQIHGVTFDGKLVWFARDNELVAFDPNLDKVVRKLDIPNANAGTAFDGEHLYQIANSEILVIEPSDGRIVRRLPAPGKGGDSGMAWADGHLWIGQFRESKIHKVDAKTGEVVKTLTSDRFVTGVSCVDGELWHGVSNDGGTPELRHLRADGSVEETLEVPVKAISGVERTKSGDFWCGDRSKLHLVRKSTSKR
jgi:outer membrane protein assembly factor BamB